MDKDTHSSDETSHQSPLSPGRSPASQTPNTPHDAGPRTSTVVLATVLAVLFLFLGIALAEPVKGLWTRVAGDHGEADHDHETGQWYISGMHPWIIRPEPGLCPVCGMELTPLSPAMLTGDLAIDPQIVQNIGVRLASVQRAPFRTFLHTVGTVEIDERLRREVVLRAPGYVETSHVRYVGQQVERGDPLVEVHSPEILSAFSELRAFRRSGLDGPEVRATRERLRILGLTAESIADIEAADEVPWTVTISSPASGVVTSLDAFEGQWVSEGGRLLEIADLGRMWVLATVFESQLDRVREGMRGVARLAGRPGANLEGEVAYIYPTLDPRTRQGRLRLEFENGDGTLKPGMFVRLELQDPGEEDVLQIPREAVLDTGLRQVAYVSRGDGRFEPREVRVGRESEAGMVEVFDGLSEGEPVVVSGQFLLDSESRLRESLLKLVMGDTAAEQRVQAPADASPELEAMPDNLARALGDVLDSYLQVGASLVDDHLRGLPQAAATIRAAAGRFGDGSDLPESIASVLGSEGPRIERAASQLGEAPSPRAARIALRDLSDGLRAILHATGVPRDYRHEIHEVRCPMFPELGDMAWWFQTDTTTANPYMGQAMLTCHDRRFAIPRTGEAAPPTPPTQVRGEPEPEPDPDAGGEVARGEITRFPAMELPEAGQDALAQALRAYLAIGTTLVGDRVAGIRQDAAVLEQGLQGMAATGTVADAHAFHAEDLLARARQAAGVLARTNDIKEARMAFAILGEEMVGLVEAVGTPSGLDTELIAARCHMYPNFGDNGWWIQVSGELENPLWGPAMLRCADVARPLVRSGGLTEDFGGNSHD